MSGFISRHTKINKTVLARYPRGISRPEEKCSMPKKKKASTIKQLDDGLGRISPPRRATCLMWDIPPGRNLGQALTQRQQLAGSRLRHVVLPGCFWEGIEVLGEYIRWRWEPALWMG